MGFRHFIFDLDGTLLDTERAVLMTWQLTLREEGYEFSLEQLSCVLGITSDKALEKLGARVGAGFMDRWKKNYEKFSGQTVFFAGVREMLLALREKGCLLGIVTSRDREEYTKFFQPMELDALFPIIVCEDDTRRHKPEPEPLFKYMELAGAKSGSCIYIGDMPTDIACANSAGIVSGLVTWNGSGIVCPEAGMVFERPEEVVRCADHI